VNEYSRRLFGVDNSEEEERSKSSIQRFQMGLKLFYRALENILIIERKRLISIKQTNEQIHQAFQ
jgi:hypothetical protein